MILAIDIGNSNLVIGILEDDQILFESRLRTDSTKTSDEYCIDLKMLLEVYGIDSHAIEGCIIASVVPQVLNSMQTAVMKLTGKTSLVVGPGVGEGTAVAHALDGMARQPEMAGTLRSTMIMGCAIAETTGIYSLVIALLIMFLL